jgi:hypothetical protein
MPGTGSSVSLTFLAVLLFVFLSIYKLNMTCKKVKDVGGGRRRNKVRYAVGYNGGIRMERERNARETVREMEKIRSEKKRKEEKMR